MACETKLWLMLLLLAATCTQHSHGEPQVPCLFIYGDSSSDNGNNNYLPASIKANWSPYGVDFPKGTTGRFNNGKTTIDAIGELLGIEDFIPPFSDYLPPYANPHVSDILLGVNYASAGGGIHDQTGNNLGQIFSLRKQINHHNKIFFEIALKLGSIEEARKHLNQCLYYLDLGTNDYVNNYFVTDIFSTSVNYTTEQFAELLHEEYYHHLKVLYTKGARKFAISGVGFLGCRPYQIRNHKITDGSCVKSINDAVQLFNEGLRPLVDKLNKEYSDSKFMYVNYTAIQSSAFPDFITDAECCQTEKFYGMCMYNGTSCNNRDKYAFWDGGHTSDALNKIAAKKSYSDPESSFTYPMDIKTLVKSSSKEGSMSIIESMMYQSI